MTMASYQGYKDKLRELLVEMERSPAEVGMPMLDAFVNDYEDSLYNEIGRLTRQLHDSLMSFQVDANVLDLTKERIPDAKERLRYVVTVNEQATQNVLSIVEKSIPVLEAIGAKAQRLRDECARMTGGACGGERLSRFMGDVGDFLNEAKGGSGLVRGYLTEILMAQEYQDITGQIIKKVIVLVQDVEDSLVKLIKLTGHKAPLHGEIASVAKAHGPHVPGVDDHREHVSGQDDVDQLLASLGF